MQQERSRDSVEFDQERWGVSSQVKVKVMVMVKVVAMEAVMAMRMKTRLRTMSDREGRIQEDVSN